MGQSSQRFTTAPVERNQVTAVWKRFPVEFRVFDMCPELHSFIHEEQIQIRLECLLLESVKWSLSIKLRDDVPSLLCQRSLTRDLRIIFDPFFPKWPISIYVHLSSSILILWPEYFKYKHLFPYLLNTIPNDYPLSPGFLQKPPNCFGSFRTYPSPPPPFFFSLGCS